MSNAKRYNLTAALEYDAGGETKTAWVRLGTLWVRDDGSIGGVLEVCPTGTWFDGRIHAFRADEKRGGRSAPQAREPEQKAPAPGGDFEDDSEIPF